MKKLSKILLIIFTLSFILTGCASPGENINVISREDGSGTRSAFVEIIGLTDGDNDLTSDEAIIQNSTNGVMATVEGDEKAIGYISTGSINETIKPLKVDGVEPTSENIKSGDYKISRPFLLVYKGDLDELKEDFLTFILSNNGQAIVEDTGYIAQDASEDYSSSNLEGKITVSGSTSVTPIMEALKEEYEKLNPGVSIEIQSPGSSAGITATLEDAADFGMVSRELKPEEAEKLKSESIAIDGIGVIVNKDNPIEDISLENVKSIFKGEVEKWEEIK